MCVFLTATNENPSSSCIMKQMHQSKELLVRVFYLHTKFVILMLLLSQMKYVTHSHNGPTATAANFND